MELPRPHPLLLAQRGLALGGAVLYGVAELIALFRARHWRG